VLAPRSPNAPWRLLTHHALFDITAGTNHRLGDGAACGHDYLCEAKKGYDAPTGLGTPTVPSPSDGTNWWPLVGSRL